MSTILKRKQKKIQSELEKSFENMIGQPYSSGQLRKTIKNAFDILMKNEVINNFKVHDQTEDEEILHEVFEETNNNISAEYTPVVPLNYIKYSFTINNKEHGK